jgi:hypothetical protein
MTSRHRSILELDESIERMKEFHILESPCFFGYPDSLSQMELLTNIDTVDDLRWIPTVGHTILDCSKVTREIESCSVLFLENTRWYLSLLWEDNSDTPILVLSGDSLLDQLSYNILHIVL